ncbi:MAG: hypothetical protein AAF546_14235, partial [Verrucomicrobiota bacterium]
MEEGTQNRQKPVTLHALLHALVDANGSDLHLAPDHAPLFRIDGYLKTIEPFQSVLSNDKLEAIIKELTSSEACSAIPESGSLDGALSLSNE